VSNDQRGSPFQENKAQLLYAIREGKRIGHEAKNVCVEWIREHPATTLWITLGLVLLLVLTNLYFYLPPDCPAAVLSVQ